jgi:uncharacterized phage protein gp47/JayE
LSQQQQQEKQEPQKSAFRKKSYKEIVDAVLAQLANGQVDEKYTYTSDQVRYKLAHSPIRDVLRVESESNETPTVFTKSIDFRVNGDTLEWIDKGKKPDDGSVFFIRYLFGEPTSTRRLTDTNVGSVTRNLVETIAKEIDFLYEQLDAVYASAFIDSATGDSLDFVVAVLGLTRKPPQNAVGAVTFGRVTDPPEVPVDAEVALFDGSPDFKLKVTPVKSIKKIEGIVRGAKYSFTLGKDFKLADNKITWTDPNNKPDLDSQIRVEYTAFQRVTVPKGTRVSTFSNDTRRIRTYTTLQDVVLHSVTNEQGESTWEVDVPIRADRPGPFGNGAPGSITTMPQPPVGVEFVINRRGITGGTEAEGDLELRDRAKRVLQSIGKATIPSLEGALRGVEGVRSVKIEDMPDDARGIVKVVVQGGDTTMIEKVIQDTRAAGVMVELFRPQVLYADIDITVNLKVGVAPDRTREKVEDAIRTFMSSLDVGQDIVYNRIIAQVMAVSEVHDVVSMKISAFNMEKHEVRTSTGTNIRIERNELVEPRTILAVTESPEEEEEPEIGEEQKK